MNVTAFTSSRSNTSDLNTCTTSPIASGSDRTMDVICSGTWNLSLAHTVSSACCVDTPTERFRSYAAFAMVPVPQHGSSTGRLRSLIVSNESNWARAGGVEYCPASFRRAMIKALSRTCRKTSWGRVSTLTPLSSSLNSSLPRHPSSDIMSSPTDGQNTFMKSHSSEISCLLYTSDAADDLLCVDLGGR